MWRYTFLSTPSARRATGNEAGRTGRHGISIHALREEGDHAADLQGGWCINFYPRPPRGGRPWVHPDGGAALHISIHALREEGDLRPRRMRIRSSYFYPRPPRGGRPGHDRRQNGGGQISIHALREEGDLVGIFSQVSFLNFYPRPPRGGRRPRGWSCAAPPQFLSTPSARRATWVHPDGGAALHISIHALREEGDSHSMS